MRCNIYLEQWKQNIFLVFRILLSPWICFHDSRHICLVSITQYSKTVWVCQERCVSSCAPKYSTRLACLSQLLCGLLLSIALLCDIYYECHQLHSFLSFVGGACAWCFQILPCSPFLTPVPPSYLLSSSSQSRMLNKQTNKPNFPCRHLLVMSKVPKESENDSDEGR